MTTAPVLSVSSQRPTGAGTRTWKALAVVAASLTALVIPAAHADEFNTVLSAGIGAAAGAVIGHSIGGHRGALIGAGTGGLIGASVAQQQGYRSEAYMPAQPLGDYYQSYPTYSAYPTYSTYPAYRAPTPVYYAPPRVVVVRAPVYVAPQWRPEYRHGYGNYYGRGGWDQRAYAPPVRYVQPISDGRGYQDHYRRGYRDHRDY